MIRDGPEGPSRKRAAHSGRQVGDMWYALACKGPAFVVHRVDPCPWDSSYLTRPMTDPPAMGDIR